MSVVAVAPPSPLHTSTLNKLKAMAGQLDADEALGDACRALGVSIWRIWTDDRKASRMRQRRMVAKALEHQGFNHSEIARAMKRTRSAVIWLLRGGRTKAWKNRGAS